MLMDYNLWSPLSLSKNAIVIEHVFTDVAVVFPKLSIIAEFATSLWALMFIVRLI